VPLAPYIPPRPLPLQILSSHWPAFAANGYPWRHTCVPSKVR
jgi:hypothetical protein